MAFKSAQEEATAATRINDVWLYVPDTAKPVEWISKHAGVTKLPRFAPSSDCDPGDDR